MSSVQTMLPIRPTCNLIPIDDLIAGDQLSSEKGRAGNCEPDLESIKKISFVMGAYENYENSKYEFNITTIELTDDAAGCGCTCPIASLNVDGTWTATIPAPWSSGSDYKWVADGVEENLKDDQDAGYCESNAPSAFRLCLDWTKRILPPPQFPLRFPSIEIVHNWGRKEDMVRLCEQRKL